MSNHTASGPLASADTFWAQNGDSIETLLAFSVGILVYGLVVNMFYQVISKRIMFAGKSVNGEVRVGGPGRGFVYLMFFPLVSFGYFLLLSVALLFLGGDNQTPQLTFTLAMAVVAAVRLAAYISEPTAHDVAKMLPLGLLGVMLVQAKFLDLVSATKQLKAIFEEIDLVILYFGIVVVLEYFLRTVWLIFHFGKRSKGKQVEDTQFKSQ